MLKPGKRLQSLLKQIVHTGELSFISWPAVSFDTNCKYTYVQNTGEKNSLYIEFTTILSLNVKKILAVITFISLFRSSNIWISCIHNFNFEFKRKHVSTEPSVIFSSLQLSLYLNWCVINCHIIICDQRSNTTTGALPRGKKHIKKKITKEL